ncbi:hypothetical protein PV327_008314 [Microctonus hyperodae]|uniref:Ig-like domain-containing protein n=1 Tax=Microctonus hyperodae TaxID=165561 RepID=A0AA39F2T9_MICHY|nr:hypothetical protein PV327_008314 [Microctonus hyperodae]
MAKHWIPTTFFQTSVCAFIYICITLIGHVQESTQLIIKSMNVPPLVRAGEVDYVILDCDYDLQNISSDGLVVKWFFNYDNLDYQWIYGYEPQADPTASHIDLGYKASDDPYTMYRAMKLNNPSINLTGDYRCTVFTYEDEQIADASMIVYSVEEKFDLQYRKRIVDGKDGMEVTCFAEGLYPQPTIDISINDMTWNDTDKPDLTMRDDGKYNIMMRVAAKDEDLPSEALVKCNLAIPKANYSLPRQLTYYSGGSHALSSRWTLTVISIVTFTAFHRLIIF